MLTTAEQERAAAEKEGKYRCDMNSSSVLSFWSMLDIDFDSFVGEFYLIYRAGEMEGSLSGQRLPRHSAISGTRAISDARSKLASAEIRPI